MMGQTVPADTPVPLHRLREVDVEDGDRRRLRVDPLGPDVLVDQRLHPRPGPSDVELAVPVAVTGLHVDEAEVPRVAGERQPLGPWQQHVQGFEEQPQLDRELGPRLDVGQEVHALGPLLETQA
jgi:hypothetical protein